MRKNPLVILGVSAGIAAYKIIELVKILKSRGNETYVVMTENAVKMFGTKEFEKASGHRVYTQLFPSQFDYKNVLKRRQVEHIDLALRTDLVVIAPATANIIGKIANGIADDFLTTTVLATNAPILICPSMNTNMWRNPIVAENVDKLKKRGFNIFGPDSGLLACGTTGAGRLPNVNIIADEIDNILRFKSRLKGKKIIVTAGGTQESIDTVRVITNRSSGKMGVTLAETCHLQGAEPLLLRANTSIKTSYPIRTEIFETAKDLERLIKKYVKQYDIIFHTAAVSDFVPGKILDKKLDSRKSLILKLKPAPKILHKIKSWNPNIKLIGFKAVYKETENNLIKRGIKKLQESQADYIIVNDVGKEGIGFAADDNEVYIISPKGLLAKISKAPKIEVARKIINLIEF